MQDLGRPGLADIGVGAAGAADRAALALANRLVGNVPTAAGLEITFGGLVCAAEGVLLVALCGAPCPLRVSGAAGADSAGDHPAGIAAPFALHDGQRLAVGRPLAGARTYLAVRGGLAVPPVLGSRSTDLLAGLGPEPLSAGARLPVGTDTARLPAVDLAPVPAPPAGPVTLRVLLGPREEWFLPSAVATLLGSEYAVSPQSNRIGVRLVGPPLPRARAGELPSEGMVPGAVQVPPTGQPTILLADAPVTGGYPVLAVVTDADLDRVGQLRPGQVVRFRRAR